MTNVSEMSQSLYRVKKQDLKRKRFNLEEDQMICELVERYGTKNWDEIAKAMGGNRTKRQIRERWQAYLTPDITLMYTEAEDQQFETLFFEFGTQWAKIVLMIGGKSAISVRNRHRTLQSMKARGFKPNYQELENEQIDIIESEQQLMFEFTDLEFDSWEWN
jgi:hypothetical protein